MRRHCVGKECVVLSGTRSHITFPSPQTVRPSTRRTFCSRSGSLLASPKLVRCCLILVAEAIFSLLKTSSLYAEIDCWNSLLEEKSTKKEMRGKKNIVQCRLRNRTTETSSLVTSRLFALLYFWCYHKQNSLHAALSLHFISFARLTRYLFLCS